MGARRAGHGLGEVAIIKQRVIPLQGLSDFH